MDLAFENHYVVGVIVFMTVLLCCKNLLEVLQVCFDLAEKCALPSCCACRCLHYSNKEFLVTISLVTITICSIGQPIIILATSITREYFQNDDNRWHLQLVQLEYNQTEIRNYFAATQSERLYHTDGSLTVSSMDGILAVMPFALCSAASSWVWFNLKLTGYFDNDPLWSVELFEDSRIRWYEILYYMETFCLLFALALLSSDPAPLSECFLMSGLVTAIMIFFFICSRIALHEWNEHWMPMLALAILCMLTSVFVSVYWTRCVTNVMASLCMAIFFPLLAMAHLQAAGNWHAGTVILLRSCFSVSHTLLFCVMIVLGPSARCSLAKVLT